MKCFVKFIGVLDKEGGIHHVPFAPGLNIITGKSSTGKSAIIEIFDYCFGSEEYTVPEGEITKASSLYFTVLGFESFDLVLARRPDDKHAFVREVESWTGKDPLFIDEDFFENNYFRPLKDFKDELGRYFSVKMDSVDEDDSYRAITGRKSPTPSVRSFTSFMLQHQNLIANKHAVFYRFDEKEKREQVIKHFKIFMGVANQAYFVLSQRLEEMSQELRKLELALPRREEEKKNARTQIEHALEAYEAISGSKLIDLDAAGIMANPERSLQRLGETTIKVDANNSDFDRQRQGLDAGRSKIVADLRAMSRKKTALQSSVQSATNFVRNADDIPLPDRADIAISACPFCQSAENQIEHEANRLVEAIDWLNNELRVSPYMRETFEAEEREIDSQIRSRKEELKSVQAEIDVLDKQTAELARGRSISELAIRAKNRVEATLELYISLCKVDLQPRIGELRNSINDARTELAKFDVAQKMEEVRVFIDKEMKDIGANFDFEESYLPINLRFGLDTFDLWHEQDGKKIFLRSMGSGANWLYCHLTLFLALHRAFAAYSSKGCKIPPILFLDQPTQVYFPNYFSDSSEEFDAEELAQGVGREGRVDDDLKSVVKMYKELIRCCELAEERYGLMPQIIVSDHADHLELVDRKFESYVRARWRTHGFIHP
ncbi:DUF3732 domain-containing protein [Dyella sp. GSA-30]|uniref:DUF3732 domain-containing protein n=1 Tax=Dyella sp. GSA-30 TaxID=2994496 RepID=UPI0024914908|nr:DUF3732 domain-containing protein [Dyella sp. GSA-30]BDU18617.1 ATPase [Dyella sp. GSA-30]